MLDVKYLRKGRWSKTFLKQDISINDKFTLILSIIFLVSIWSPSERISSEAIDAIASCPMYSSKSSLPKSIANIAAGSMISLQEWTPQVRIEERTKFFGNMIKIHVTKLHLVQTANHRLNYHKREQEKTLTLKSLTSHMCHRPGVALDHLALGRPLPTPV